MLRWLGACAVLALLGATDAQAPRKISWSSVGHSATATSQNGAFSPPRAIDGSVGTYWEAKNGHPPSNAKGSFLPASAAGQTWFRVKWKLPVCVSEVRWVVYSPAYIPTSFILWAATHPRKVCTQNGPMETCKTTPWNALYSALSRKDVKMLPGNTVVVKLPKTVCSHDWAISYPGPSVNKVYWPSIRELSFYEGGTDGEPTHSGWVQLGGKNTVCRLHGGDTTGDAQGQAKAVKAKTLEACESLCEAEAGCVAVEFRLGHCEKWKSPPRGTARVSGYECWIRAHVADAAAHGQSGRKLASLAMEFRTDTLGSSAPRRSLQGPVVWEAVYPPGLSFQVGRPTGDGKTKYGRNSEAPFIADHDGTGLSWTDAQPG